MTVNHQFVVEEYRNKPALAILNGAEHQQVNMIVMGSRGIGTLRRTILGSISDYVLHHANVPVLICH